MSVYTKAASYVLDALWENEDFREHFHNLHAELADLGPLSQVVFEPAYRKFKASLDEDALLLLESQVTQDLITPLFSRPGFREMWTAWDEATRDEFVKEQSELQVARLLIQVYDKDLDRAYREAYAAYLAGQETRHRK